MPKSLGSLFVVSALITGAAAFACSAAASPGEIDSSFGSDGIVRVPVGSPAGQVAKDSALQGDGKLVVVGRSEPKDSGLVVRYLPKGGLDPDFGDGGTATVPGVAFDAVTIDNEGRLLLAGSSSDHAVIIRLLADGRLDDSFASQGRYLTPIARPSAWVTDRPKQPQMSAITVAEDGTILAAGRAGGCKKKEAYFPECDFAVMVRVDQEGDPVPLARVDDDGEPVPAEGGIVGTWAIYTSSSELSFGSSLETVDLLPDGRLVLAWSDFDDSVDGGFDYFNTIDVYGKPDAQGTVKLLWHDITDRRKGTVSGSGQVSPTNDGGFLLASGSLIYKAGPDGPDDGFGSEGRVRFDQDSFRGSTGVWKPFARNAVLTAEGIVVTGAMAAKGRRGTFIARLDQQGQPDPTFSNDGFRGLWARAIQPAPDPDPNAPVRLLRSGDSYIVVATTSVKGPGLFSLASFHGGAGQMAYCDGRPATWIGGPGDDKVKVNSGVVVSGKGNDRIKVSGYFGSPLVCAGAGDDQVTITRGHAFGGPGDDVISGDPTKPRGRFFQPKSEVLDGGPGNDRLYGHAGDDTIHGGPGNDVINGGQGDDDLYGQGGRDRLIGGYGNDHLFGGPGRDHLDGGPKAKPSTVYSGTVAGTDLEMVRVGKRMVRTTVVVDEYCSMLNPASDGYYRIRYVFPKPLAIRGKRRQINFSSSYSDDWSSEEVRLRTRLTGKLVTGTFKRTEPSPWWAACWTGKSERDPWVKVQARLQPKRVQIVRQ